MEKNNFESDKMNKYFISNITEYYICSKEGGGIELVESLTFDEKINELSDEEMVIDFFNEYYRLDLMVTEYMYVIGYCGKFVKGIYQLGHGIEGSVEYSKRNLFQFLLLTQSENFIMIHNHPNYGSPEHSDGDVNTMESIDMLSRSMGLNFISSIVVSPFGHDIAKYNEWKGDTNI